MFTDSLSGTNGICVNGTAVTGAECTVGTRVDGTGNCTPTGFQFGVQPYCSGGTGGMSGCVSGTYANT